MGGEFLPADKCEGSLSHCTARKGKGPRQNNVPDSWTGETPALASVACYDRIAWAAGDILDQNAKGRRARGYQSTSQ